MAIDIARIDVRGEAVLPKASRVRRPGGPGGFARRDLLSSIPFLNARRVSLDDLILFVQQLALLLQTGNALAPSIGALASQTRSPAFKKVLDQVHSRLEEGVGFSECLAEHPDVFDSLFVSLVRAGEATGALPEGFERLSGILEIRQQLRARIREAMAYPMVLTVVMTGVVIFIMTYLLPRFAGVFEGLGDALPRSTRLLLSFASFFRSRWWLLLPMMGLVVGGIRWLWRMEPARRVWDRLRMSVPFVGMLHAKACLFQMCSTLGLLLESRVPTLDTIRITRDAVNSSQYRSFFAELTKNVEAGRGIAPAFQEASFLPESLKLMVTTGEASGALDTVMARLAKRYREDLESHIRRLSVFLEPAMLLVMGLVVGFVVISVILPIFRMSRALR